MLYCVLRVQPVHAPDHFFHRPEAQLRHNLPQFFRDEEEEVHDIFRLTGESLPQDRVLRGNPDRAGSQMADAHHNAAHRHERRGGEAELLRAEQGGDGDIAPGF